MSDLPRSEREYSTFGGICGYSLRTIIKTNIRLHRDIMADEKVRQGGVSIHYLEEKLKTLRS